MDNETKLSGRQIIEAYIRKNEGCTHTEIREALNLPTTTVGSALALIKRDGIIESRGISGHMTYHLTTSAKEDDKPVFGRNANMDYLNRLLAGVRA